MITNTLTFKKLIVFVLFLLSAAVNGQVVVFKTYKDYTDKKGTQYDDYYNMKWNASQNVTMIFKKDGDKVKIPCNEIWGFTFRGTLFRCDKVNCQPTCVISIGKVVYYENGEAHLEMIDKGSSSGSYEVGNFSYLSRDLNSELVPMPLSWAAAGKKKYVEFTQKNPEFKKLYDCIETRYDYQKIRNCVEQFEKE